MEFLPKEKGMKKGKRQRELFVILFFPDMDHPEQ
jgi:hypothetical protein